MNGKAKTVGQSEQENVVDWISISDLIEQISHFLRRRYLIFLIVTGAVMGCGIFYLLITPASYTAHAMMLIDSSKLPLLQQLSLADVPLDNAQVETQVEVLKSENIALSVIKDLRLTEDAEFVETSAESWRALFRATIGAFVTGEAATSAESQESLLLERALGAFLRRRAVNRVERTYVLDIAFTSVHPKRAAEIANKIAEAYIDDQLEAKYQATRRASKWLEERIAELQAQASAVDRAVIDYKEKNKIVDVETAPSPGSTDTSTRSLEDQQLAELSSQFIAARAATTEAKARLDRIQEILKQDIPDAAVADELRNEVVIRLRNQYVDLASREGIWSARYGSDHFATVNLRNQMYQIRQSIRDELRRIAESYNSDYQIAKTKEESLKQRLSDVVSDARTTSRERVGLRELESNAQAYHSIYDNFLQRYTEAIQQQSFPITEARVIGAATAPRVSSGPRASIVFGACALLGLLCSLVIAVLREALDRVFRNTRQVHEALHTNCLGVLPLLDAPKPSPLSVAWRRLVTLRDRGTDHGVRTRLATGEFFRSVVSEPLSPFTDAIRSIKVAADLAGTGSRVIGFTSTLPNEGKSTVASNFAELIAQSRRKVVLVDGDVRNPSLSRVVAPDATSGLFEVLAGKIELHDAIRTEEATGLTFLPAFVEHPRAHTSEILASEAFKCLIARMREMYEYVVIDLPPVGPVAEVRATARVVDSFVYVVEWGRTRVGVVRQQLLGAPEVHARLLGVVLSKVDIKEFRRHEHHLVGYYPYGYYAR